LSFASTIARRIQTSPSAWQLAVELPIGSVELDHCFTDLERDDAGVARVELSAGEGGVTLWLDDGFRYLMVFTGDLPAVQRHGLAVEPMTCPPNAFRSGEALVTLEPGESHSSVWGLSPTVEVRE